MQVLGAFFQSFGLIHLMDTENAMIPTIRQVNKFVLVSLLQATECGSKERLNMALLNLVPILMRFV